MTFTLPFHIRFLFSGIAGGVAELITNPLDSARVLIQTRSKNITTEDFIKRSFKGSLFGFSRQIIFNSIRLGTIPLINKSLSFKFPKARKTKTQFISAMISSVIGILCVSPLDALRVRKQTQNINKSMNNCSLIHLYKGLLPNLVKVVLASGIQVTSYESIKSKISEPIRNERTSVIISSLLTGTIISIIAHPFDLIKTKIMNNRTSPINTINKRPLREIIEVIKKQHGIKGLYKGFRLTIVKTCIWNIVCFVTLEELNKYYLTKYKKQIIHHNI